MPYFLDGNNLIGIARGRSLPAEEDRRALVAELCERLRSTRARAVLFFDGPSAGGATALGSLSVRFAGASSADDAILREISRSPRPGEITLVTADRGLSLRARDAGAKVVAPDAFWSRFGNSRGGTPEKRPDRVDVEDWMEYFNDEGNRR